MTKPRPNHLDEKLVAEVVRRLRANARVRRSLPAGGRLHIDRQLPFLVVHRPAQGSKAPSMARFVVGEASYLIAPTERGYASQVGDLVSSIADAMGSQFGAFLVIEVYAWNEGLPAERSESGDGPAFQIAIPKQTVGAPSVRALESALRRVSINGRTASVEYDVGRRNPFGRRRSRVRGDDVADVPVTWIGIGVAPVHADTESGVEYPEVARNLRIQLSRVIQRTAFAFARHQTAQRPLHYQALGRRAFVKAVRQVDAALADVASRFDLLLSVSPINTEAAYRRFRRSQKDPKFSYRPLSVDPALLKRELYAIPVERVEDPSLEALFRDKQRELSLKLDLLADRNTPRFLPTGVALFGAIDASTRQEAVTLLRKLPTERTQRSGRLVPATELARRAEEEIAAYREVMPEMAATVTVRDDVSSMMVSSGHVIIGASQKVPLDRVHALIQHEVGTHVVTYWNGTAQPFQLLATGLDGHDELQEGFAVLAEHLVGGLTPQRLRVLAARVVAAQSLLDGATFTDTFRLLRDDYGFRDKTSFLVSTRVHRGGGLVKDAVYLRGLQKVVQYLAEGGRIETLLVGKMSVAHTAVVEELQRRHVLVPPPLRPHYLDEPDTHYRLEALRADPDVLRLADVPRP